MKKAVVTIAIGEKYEQLAKVTHPIIKAYADKIGADFIVWKDFIGHSMPAYKKLDIGKLLNDYDRVLYLDTDLIIRDDCPDLFEVVPYETFGAFNEFPFTSRADTMLTYRQDIEWVMSAKYFNTGVFVCSRIHKPVFEAIEEVNNFYEQTLVNYNIFKHDFSTFSLSHKFNRMTCIDWTGESRFDSYIMHYAGCPLNTEALVFQMRADLSAWETRPEVYQRKIHFDVNGGLGDQVCVEPVIRYLKETAYKNDDVVVTTNYPSLFKHLNVKAFEKDEIIVERDRTYYSIKLPPDSKNYAVHNHILTHPVEAASLAAFKGQLPPESKTIKLIGDNITDELKSIVEQSVLIHAGRSWQTKTFPKEFWESIVNELVENNVSVTLIGKNVDDQFGYVNIDTRKSKMIHDLRDKLSLGELVSVIKHAKHGLISNDSSPVHIAGAFDNPIHLITIAKAGFRIMPFRQGIQTYKSYCYGKLLDFRFDSNCPEEVRVDKASKEAILECLPNPKDIVKSVLNNIRE